MRTRRVREPFSFPLGIGNGPGGACEVVHGVENLALELILYPLPNCLSSYRRSAFRDGFGIDDCGFPARRVKAQPYTLTSTDKPFIAITSALLTTCPF